MASALENQKQNNYNTRKCEIKSHKINTREDRKRTRAKEDSISQDSKNLNVDKNRQKSCKVRLRRMSSASNLAQQNKENTKINDKQVEEKGNKEKISINTSSHSVSVKNSEQLYADTVVISSEDADQGDNSGQTKREGEKRTPTKKDSISHDSRRLNVSKNRQKSCKVRLRRMNSGSNLVQQEKKNPKNNYRQMTPSGTVVISSDGEQEDNSGLTKNKGGEKSKDLANIKQVDKEAPKNNDVYEFLSQSSLSEQEDPTYEVVKKLIKQGKATVARPKRGKGKQPNVKKNVPRVNINKIGKQKNKDPKSQGRVQVENIDLGSSEVEICDVVHERPTNRDADNLKNKEVEMVRSEKNIKTSSPRPIVTDKVKLLEVAKNFVNQSTPLNNKKVMQPESHLSPISISSPWRPPDERILPRVFYFWRNEDDLPSYSSDVIPSSQTLKEKIDKNLSNIENITPPGTSNNTARDKTSLNEQRILGYRSPLKSINVLQVTELPSRAKGINNTIKIPTKSPLMLRSLQNKQVNVS